MLIGISQPKKKYIDESLIDWNDVVDKAHIILAEGSSEPRAITLLNTVLLESDQFADPSAPTGTPALPEWKQSSRLLDTAFSMAREHRMAQPSSNLFRYSDSSHFVQGLASPLPPQGIGTWESVAEDQATSIALLAKQWRESGFMQTGSPETQRRWSVGSLYTDFDQSSRPTRDPAGPNSNTYYDITVMRGVAAKFQVKVLSEQIGTDPSLDPADMPSAVNKWLLQRLTDDHVTYQSDWLWMMSWNDWAEDTRIEPLWDAAYWSESSILPHVPGTLPAGFPSLQTPTGNAKYNRIFGRLFYVQKLLAEHKGKTYGVADTNDYYPGMFHHIMAQYLRDQYTGKVVAYD
jgi:hypothetical protein